MKGNAHLINLEYRHCVAYKTHTSKIFHQINCKSDFVIYLLKCNKCHIQYVSKAETDFTLKMKGCITVLMHLKLILFQLHSMFLWKRICLIEANFIIIEQIHKNTLSRETKKKLFKQRENFWILKLKTLNPKGINQELNK